MNNKLPKLKKEIPGILTAFLSSSGSDGNLVSYLEKAVVKLMCGGVYDQLKLLSMVDVYRCFAGPVAN